MNCSDDISVIGFSSVGAIVSLLLAESGIEHSYYMKKGSVSPLKLPPLSNPLVNGPTQLIEKRFISKKYLDNVRYIKHYNFLHYDNDFKLQSQLSGEYNVPIYAIDSRIRHHSFLNKIKNSDKITTIETELLNEKELKSSINIVGRNNFFDGFETNIKYPTLDFPNKRVAFFFNLRGNKLLLDKYKDATMLFIGSIGEITIYPFLHKDMHQAINVTITFNKGEKWDCFSEETNSKMALNKLVLLLEKHLPELATDLSMCLPLDDDFFLLDLFPYFNKSTKQKDNKIFFGVGEVIVKTDPILGQGYNSGVEIGHRLCQLFKQYKAHNSLSLLISEYKQHTDTLTNYLYHINRSFTQGTQNNYLGEFYALAEKSVPLKRELISAFDDISLYFPWLIDENATMELIKKHSNG